MFKTSETIDKLSFVFRQWWLSHDVVLILLSSMFIVLLTMALWVLDTVI